MKGWVYILKLSNGKYYYGSTSDLPQRLDSHNNGKSNYTSKFLPVKLVFSQVYVDYIEAKKIETWLKKLRNVEVVERIILEGKIQKTIKQVHW